MLLSRRAFLKLIGAGAVAAAALSSYAFAIEPMYRLRTTRYRLQPPGWGGGPNMRVVVLADFHACQPWMQTRRIAAICGEANRLQPDIILLLGDFIAGMRLVTGPVSAQEWSSELANLKAPLGVHAIQGNHDWWHDEDVQRAGGGETVAYTALRNIGIPVYENRAVRLEKDGKAFWLAGLSSQLALLPGYGRTRMQGLDDLDGTLAEVGDEAPIILMAHEPDIFPTVPSRVSLTLSGHTHGGQVRLLGYSPVVPSRYGNRYAYGHVVERERHLIVSGGLGCSILPVRFGSPPEITVVEIG